MLLVKSKGLIWRKEMKKIRKSWMTVYLLIYFSVIFMYCSMNVPNPIGEWDDYSLPVASLLHEHNFSITESDIAAYKKLFPEWSEKIDHYSLSGYVTKGGGEMTWYFPVYSAICIPFVIILKALKLSAIYAFSYTNIAVLMLSLLIVYKYLNIKESKRNLLILALSIHPVIFYLGWISAEVFAYSCLIITMVCWFNKWYKRAALAVSVAGMMNPTILCVGIIMIIEYLFKLIKNKNKEVGFWEYMKGNTKKVISYGSCYIIALVPLLYNYYHTGHINLTASYSAFVHGKESVGQRFLSYIFDLNYGLFPYFMFIVMLAAGMMIVSLIHKNWRFLEWMSVLFLNIVLYAINMHINCGISGIARYNVWVSAVLIFAVIVYYEAVFHNLKAHIFIKGWLLTGICVTGFIVYTYGPYRASETSYVYMTPVAEIVLDKFPELYNPLHSSFQTRVAHVNGGYDYQTPIVYIAKDGYVRKILASEKDRENLIQNYVSAGGYDEWFHNKIWELSDSEEYITVPKKYKIVQCPALK